MKKLAVLVGIFLLSHLVRAETYVIDGAQSHSDSVVFQSTAKLEFIQGATNGISGEIQFNPAHTLDSMTGSIQVDLRTLKTGIEMRDEHMRTRHLETDKFPYAFFELVSVKGLPEKLAAGVTCTCSVAGYFYIHGIKRKITPTVEIVDNSSGGIQTIQVHAQFSLNLDEWKIPRPKALFLKLAENLVVDVRFIARVGKSTGAVVLPDWPEG